jgi:hypothetical protein
VSNFRQLRKVSFVFVCLAFTGGDVAWADDDTPTAEQVGRMVPSPTARADSGSSVRLGTAVGFIYGAPTDVIAVGPTVAIGQRFGRLAVEAEYALLAFEARGDYDSSLGTTDGNVGVGYGHRLAVMGRYDVVHLGPMVDRRRSLVTFYVEGGIGNAWNHWTRPAYNEPNRVVPDNTKRTEGQAGFGIMIFPHRVAWLLGWRFAFSPHEEMTGSLCRGDSCRPVPMTDSGSYVDRSMLFQSSLELTF